MTLYDTTCHPYLLEIEGLLTQGWRPGRIVGESVGGILEMDTCSYDWSNGIRHHTFDTRSDTEFKLSVGVTCHAYLLEIEGLFTQGSQPGRTVGESVGGILEMASSDWSNGIQYHIIATRPDTEFNLSHF
jgi:hypothetical protein